MPRKQKAPPEALPGVPITHALLNQFAPDRLLTAGEVVGDSTIFALRVSAGSAPRDVYDERAGECAARVRKIIKTRGHFPTDEAATKLIWLALRNIMADWSRAARDWKTALNQFAILYEDRFLTGPAVE
jgi:putative transposase